MLCMPRNDSIKKKAPTTANTTATRVDPFHPVDASSLASDDHASLEGVEKFFTTKRGSEEVDAMEVAS
jgi:hypothetical protein